MYDTILNLTTGRDHRAIGGAIQDRPMSRNYRITDPVELAGRLQAGGFDTRIISRGRKGKLAVGGTPWRAIVTALEPTFLDRDYRRTVGFLCAHDGRTAFCARVGVNCEGCLNQFSAAPVRIMHTDPEIDSILADPAGFARRLIGSADRVLERLDSLRSVGRAGVMFNAIRHRPRLLTAALRSVSRYPGDTFWTALQAFTDTKSPTLVHLSDLALGEGFEVVEGGHLPACWDRVLGPAPALNQ